MKNILKNITPSITIMVVGLVGAYFVYNTYFSDRVAADVAQIQPAAGHEVMVEEATEEAADLVHEDSMMENTTDAVEDMAEDVGESVEEMTEEMDATVEEAVEDMEDAAEDMHEEAEDAATEHMEKKTAH